MNSCIYVFNPFYIRWRNNDGGYEHFMFSIFQEQEYSSKSLGEIKKYDSDIANSKGYNEIRGSQKLKKVNVIKKKIFIIVRGIIGMEDIILIITILIYILIIILIILIIFSTQFKSFKSFTAFNSFKDTPSETK